MKENYAFAVSRVRALEQSLLTKQQITRLISSHDVKAVFDTLATFGWETPNNLIDYNGYLTNKLTSVFNELKDCMGESQELNLLVARNDFQNLKSALKNMVASSDNDNLFVYPANIETKIITQAVTTRNFDILPKYLADVANEGYEIVTNTVDGQLLDSYIDKASLLYLLKTAKSLENEMLNKYFSLLANLTDIKVAYRCALTGKDYKFSLDSLCGTDDLPSETLALYASKGANRLLSFIETTAYGEFVKYLKTSAMQFEKETDNALLNVFVDADFYSFGVEPLLAYYIAAENEIKAIRLIITCKRIQTDSREIYERMRNPYV